MKTIILCPFTSVFVSSLLAKFNFDEKLVDFRFTQISSRERKKNRKEFVFHKSGLRLA